MSTQARTAAAARSRGDCTPFALQRGTAVVVGGEEISKIVEFSGALPAVAFSNQGVYRIGKNALAAVKTWVLVEDITCARQHTRRLRV